VWQEIPRAQSSIGGWSEPNAPGETPSRIWVAGMAVDEGAKAISSVVEASREAWLLSHQTTRERLDSIIEDGLVPQFHDFRGIQDRMTFATDAKDGDFRHVRRQPVGTNRRDPAYVVFERPEGVEHVYEFLARRNPEELRRVVAQGLVDAMKDWFVTTKVIGPESIAIIYGYDGHVLYLKESLSQ